MKTPLPQFGVSASVVATILAVAISCVDLPAATTNATTVARSTGVMVQVLFIEPAVPQAKFVVPKKSTEGRDPFFPKSTRVYGVDPTIKTNVVPAPVADLALKGISGTPEQPLAIINNITFTAGEENDIATQAGKIRIRCLEINMAAGTVRVQFGGQIRELRLNASK